VSGKLHSKFEAPVNLGGPEGRFKVEARSSIKCEIEDGKEPMLQVSTPPRQALEKFLSFGPLCIDCWSFSYGEP